MLRRGWLRAPAVSLVAVAVAGCAVRDAPIAVQSWPPAAPARRASTSVIMRYRIDGQDEPVATLADDARDAVLAALRDSELFAEIVAGLGATERQIELTIDEHDTTNVPLTILCGLTLFLVPTTEVRAYTLTTTVRDAHGALRGTDERRASLTNWIELFLVAAPAEDRPRRVASRTLYDLERSAIVDLHAVGAL